MNKLQIKEAIWNCVKKSYEIIYKLEFSEKHAMEVSELKNSSVLKHLHRIGSRKTVYQSIKKEELEMLLNEAMGILHSLETSQKEVHTYETDGVEFIEHEDFVGVSSVSIGCRWDNFVIKCFHTFHKPISFMVLKHNALERELMKKWNHKPIEEIQDYYRYMISLSEQSNIMLKYNRRKEIEEREVIQNE